MIRICKSSVKHLSPIEQPPPADLLGRREQVASRTRLQKLRLKNSVALRRKYETNQTFRISSIQVKLHLEPPELHVVESKRTCSKRNYSQCSVVLCSRGEKFSFSQSSRRQAFQIAPIYLSACLPVCVWGERKTEGFFNNSCT